MKLVEPRTLSGFMELKPSSQLLFEKYKNIIESTYQKYSFTPIDTPVIEYANVLLAKAGGETEKQIYRLKKGDNDLALRFDLTVPLAKYVAKNYNELVFPFKRYQIGKVYRGERAQRGRFREFYQCDIDVIGDETLPLIYDAQIPVDLKVDANHAAGYDILTIHYAYVGANASNQKSEKDIVLVCKSAAGFLNTIETELKKLL